MKLLSYLMGLLGSSAVLGEHLVELHSNELNFEHNTALFSNDIKLSFDDMFLVKHSLGYRVDRIRIAKVNHDAFQLISAAPERLQQLCRDTKGLCEKFSFSDNLDPKSPAGLNGGTTTKLNQDNYLPAGLTLNLFSDVNFKGLSYFRLSLSEQVGVESKSLGAVITESMNGYASSIRFDNDTIKSMKIKQDKGYFVQPIDGIIKTELYGKGLYAIIEGVELPENTSEKLAFPVKTQAIDNEQAQMGLEPKTRINK